MALRRPAEITAILHKLENKGSLTDKELQSLQSHIDTLESPAVKADTHHHDTHSRVDEELGDQIRNVGQTRQG